MPQNFSLHVHGWGIDGVSNKTGRQRPLETMTMETELFTLVTRDNVSMISCDLQSNPSTLGRHQKSSFTDKAKKL